MRRHALWLCVALVSGIAGVAAAQKPVKCDDCKPEIEITADNWPCMKQWVADLRKVKTDPFEFPVYPDGECQNLLGFKPYDFEAAALEKARVPLGWISLRVSEAKCLSQLGPSIDQRLTNAGTGKIVVTLADCKLRG